ncbi:c-type cytochrome [Shimia sp.]|uniref:c-type cytochrome n=1 Tax=Shimia sp. TaxID=1954381 RepID=UPI003298E38F
MGRKFILAGTLLAVSWSMSPAFAESKVANRAFQEIKVEAGQTLFDIQCRRCHSDDKSDPSYGPELIGIIGRPAGDEEGYEYSDALQNSGIVWTKAALRAWMEDNDGFMPGTKMRHVGIEDMTVQDFILAYLETLTE